MASYAFRFTHAIGEREHQLGGAEPIMSRSRSSGYCRSEAIILSGFEYIFTAYLYQTPNSELEDVNLPAKMIIDYVALDPGSVRNLRQVTRTLKSRLEPYKTQSFKEVFFTYPPSFRGPRSSAYEGLARVREGVRHLHIKIKPSNNMPLVAGVPDLNCVLHLENLTKITITLLPDESGGLEFMDLCNAKASAEIDPIWTWLNRSPTDTGLFARPSHHKQIMHLRDALEESVNVLKKLDTISFTNLSVSGIQALCVSSFAMHKTSRDDEDNNMMSRRFWQQIRHLDLNLIRWWDLSHPDENLHHNALDICRSSSQDSEHSGESNHCNTPGKNKAFFPLSPSTAQLDSYTSVPMMPQASSPTKPKEKDIYRQGLLHLHNWLGCFTPKLESLTCCWILPVAPNSVKKIVPCDSCRRNSQNLAGITPETSEQPGMTIRGRLEGYRCTPVGHKRPPSQRLDFSRCMGVNPLLLDKLPAASKVQPIALLAPASSSASWFSPPHLHWPELRALALSGAPTGGEELMLLKDRAPLLGRLRVSLDCVQPGVQSLDVGADQFGVYVAELRLWPAMKGDKVVTNTSGLVRQATMRGGKGRMRENLRVRGGRDGRELKEKTSVSEFAARAGKAVVDHLSGRARAERKKKNTPEEKYGYLPGTYEHLHGVKVEEPAAPLPHEQLGWRPIRYPPPPGESRPASTYVATTTPTSASRTVKSRPASAIYPSGGSLNAAGPASPANADGSPPPPRRPRSLIFNQPPRFPAGADFPNPLGSHPPFAGDEPSPRPRLPEGYTHANPLGSNPPPFTFNEPPRVPEGVTHVNPLRAHPPF